ncbi:MULTISPECIES: DUF389 domain-containing protein [unclassified Streptomyces]|uniref:DUF389 domain-containing protein n=1 Tax=unclassified Streptomyces TaxID=2593676 RepID=UPI0022B6390A|nr:MULTISPECIES: DUF389 domain-containing protein [unclassified Streptomyces]MCZ7416033.1 DUF389 domain-containing protein [Streptomyces sp. WMMC897]MCZ7434160.1 DUF389 domain-containing protein [Streptomyces sp. WMMC1477]
MMRLRVVCEAAQTAAVRGLLDREPGVAHLTVAEGVGRRPVGDVVEAVVAREIVEGLLDRLAELGVQRRGEVSLWPIHMTLSDSADAIERAAPGADASAVIWEELVATTGEESRLNGVYLGFLTIACLLAAVGVITDSAITLVGAMVVSPDFGPLAALAVAAAGRRRRLALRAALALGLGYPLAMLITAALTLLARGVGLFDPTDLSNLGQVAFVYHVGPYSGIVALLAGAAGMLALTSEKASALVGVFISVTTVPAAGFAVLAVVTGDWARCGQAALQLLVNLTGIAVAGAVTLLLRRRHALPAARLAGHRFPGAKRH